MAAMSSSLIWFWFRPLVNRAEPSTNSTLPRRSFGFDARKMRRQAGMEVE